MVFLLIVGHLSFCLHVVSPSPFLWYPIPAQAPLKAKRENAKILPLTLGLPRTREHCGGQFFLWWFCVTKPPLFVDLLGGGPKAWSLGEISSWLHWFFFGGAKSLGAGCFFGILGKFIPTGN